MRAGIWTFIHTCVPIHSHTRRFKEWRPSLPCGRRIWHTYLIRRFWKKECLRFSECTWERVCGCVCLQAESRSCTNPQCPHIACNHQGQPCSWHDSSLLYTWQFLMQQCSYVSTVDYVLRHVPHLWKTNHTVEWNARNWIHIRKSAFVDMLCTSWNMPRLFGICLALPCFCMFECHSKHVYTRTWKYTCRANVANKLKKDKYWSSMREVDGSNLRWESRVCPHESGYSIFITYMPYVSYTAIFRKAWCIVDCLHLNVLY